MSSDTVTAPAADRSGHLVTSFDFELPHGYVDAGGTVHKHGSMRLATARDELAPLIDQRVRDNPAYLGVVLLSLVITRLGTLTDVHAGVIENLFAADLAYLQDFYRTVNDTGTVVVACPGCGTRFQAPAGRPGEG
ncbi:hypothetical protein [Nocardia terpenica]|uniref:hypothetical protein n=1 Tax=Nocardia terpenica TaxID=455432 RepID=UPI001EEA4DB2|nr:hypothetical protein [Nocardia terpenica]